MAGSLLCLPPHWQTPWLGAAAVAATVAGRAVAPAGSGTPRPGVSAGGRGGISGLLNNVFSALAGTLPGAPGWSIYLVAACAVLCYAAIKPCPGESPKQQVLSIAFAALAIGAAAALLVHGLVGLIALKVIPEPHHLAFIRTLTLCAAAIALAFSGSHWRRMELTWIGYATLALLAVKLVLEDLRHGPSRIHRRFDLPFCDHSDRGSPRGAHRAKGMRFAGIPGFDIETGDTQSPSAVHLRMLDAIFRSNQLHFADVHVVARSGQQRFQHKGLGARRS